MACRPGSRAELEHGAPGFRLIVCGSREFGDRLALRVALNQVFDQIPADVTLTVVTGGEEDPSESTSADRIAQEWADELKAQGLPVRREDHPARWEDPCRNTCEPGHRVMSRGRLICPAAGPYRSEEMCALGADRGLAALKTGTRSSGTKACILAMVRHGIRFGLVIEGTGRGLPREIIDLARRQDQGSQAHRP